MESPGGIAIRQEMEAVFSRLDDLHDLMKRWLDMTGLLYLAVNLDDYKIRYCYGAWDRLGHAPSDLLGVSIKDLIHPQDVERTLGGVDVRAFQFTKNEKGEDVFLNRYRCTDGKYIELTWLGKTVGTFNDMMLGVARIEGDCCDAG